MGATFSSIFGMTDEVSDEHLQLTDLGGFLSKYIFIMLDKDKKKLVSKSEYLTLVNHFREQKTTEEELDQFLKRHVEEGKSTEHIDEALFKKLIVQLAADFDRNIEERMKYLMTLFDKDGDGFVNEKDLCEVYDTIGIQVPMDPIRCLINKFDVDQDGKLSVGEFEQLGRSAMSKLFVRKEDLIQEGAEEHLVDEAIQRASMVYAPKAQASGDSNDPDVLNNNLVRDSVYLVGDEILLGKPVVLEGSQNSSNSDLIVGEPGELGDGFNGPEMKYFGVGLDYVEEEKLVEGGGDNVNALMGEVGRGINQLQLEEVE